MSAPQKSKKLTIWLIQDGEQLPLVDGAKPMRTWRLGEELARRGHEVIWWSSSFHHMLKKKVCKGDFDHKIKENFTLKLLDCGTYKKNLSFARILHHRRFGKKLHKAMRQMPVPDRIVASHPSIESSYEGTKYGEEFDVPVIVDVRDMWPDTFKDYFPGFSSHLFKIVFSIYFSKTNYAFKNSTSITSISQNMLSWATKKYKKEQSVVFYHGTDHSKNSVKIEKIIKILEPLKNKLIFTFLGTFGKTYDLETICKVAKNCNDPNVHFIFAGDGHQYASLFKKYKNIECLTFTGWLNAEESSYLLSCSHVGLLPIINDTIPNKFGEYLSYGLPILSSSPGEPKNLIKNVGYSYQCFSGNSLSNSIDMIKKEKILKIMSKNAFTLFENHFWSKNVYPLFSGFIEKTTIKKHN